MPNFQVEPLSGNDCRPMYDGILRAELQVAFFGNVCRRVVLEAIEEGAVVVELVNSSQFERRTFFQLLVNPTSPK